MKRIARLREVAGSSKHGDAGGAVLVATHDAEFADALADERLRLEAGRLVTG